MAVPFKTCSIFEAYVINPLQVSKVQIYAIQSPGYAIFVEKRKPKMRWGEESENSHFRKT